MGSRVAFAVAVLFVGCNSSRFSSRSFSQNAQHVYGLLEDVTYERPVDKGDLQTSLQKLQSSAASQNDRDLVFALNGAYGYLVGPSKQGISCFIAAREILQDKNDARDELNNCRSELAQP